ncbi:MAG: hypothetical protein FWC41_05980 [Firmicutes bacterium]|nr:hypothetical protein [Bacillota bacterium]
MLSKKDIIRAMDSYEMFISPFDTCNPDERLTPAGFNFSFTNFIISLNNKCLYELQEENIKDDVYESQIYFNLEAGDTALALTGETIWVSGSIAGTFHSKVTYASLGLGQISTTLDPGWHGQLLISMSNPNKEQIKVIVGNRKKDKCIQYKTFITLCLYRLITPADASSDNISARLEIIEDVLKKNTNRQSVQKILDNINDIKFIIAQTQQVQEIYLSVKKSDAHTLQRFKNLHATVLKKLNDIVPIKNNGHAASRSI